MTFSAASLTHERRSLSLAVKRHLPGIPQCVVSDPFFCAPSASHCTLDRSLHIFCSEDGVARFRSFVSCVQYAASVCGNPTHLLPHSGTHAFLCEVRLTWWLQQHVGDLHPFFNLLLLSVFTSASCCDHCPTRPNITKNVKPKELLHRRSVDWFHFNNTNKLRRV